jgi:hypothetical protein
VSTPASSDITWDTLRSRVWDLPGVDDLDTLLGVIGAGGLPQDEQREALITWARSAAYAPAPQQLKDEITRYLGERP